MDISHKLSLLLVFLLVPLPGFCQNEKAFCLAVDDLKFRKVERIVKKVVKENPTGQTYFNGEGSGFQIYLSPCLDSITDWIKKQDCVEDAFWDKCQEKSAIYPGHSAIGVKFKTGNGIIEKCFLIQEGTTGQINLLGWRPKIFKARKILVYRKMYDCEKFIEHQKLKCK